MPPQQRRSALCIFGIDVGTQGVRCACYDLRGNVLGQVQGNYRICCEKDLSYANPQEIWLAVLSTISHAQKVIGIRPAAIGITAVIGTVFLDTRHDPIGPAILWADQRAKHQCRAIPDQVIPSSIGRKLCPEHFLPRMLWFKQHFPVDYQKTTMVLSVKDWLVYKLTGSISCDHVTACYYGCFDVRQGVWEKEFFEEMGLNPSLLPPVKTPISLAGEISSDTGSATSLSLECPVAVGGPDGSVGSLGVGAAATGVCAIISGTTDVMTYICDCFVDVVDKGLIVNRSLVPGKFAITATLGQTGGSINALLQLFGITYESGFDRLQHEASGIVPGSDSVFMFGAYGGLRAPYWIPDAKIQITGIDGLCTQAHLYRALLENLSFVLKDCFAVLSRSDQIVTSVVLGGNGVKNYLWNQIKADILGHDIFIPAHLESSCLGSALIAAVAAGLHENVQSAVKSMVSYPEIVKVDQARQKQYANVYQNYYAALQQYLAPYNY